MGREITLIMFSQFVTCNQEPPAPKNKGDFDFARKSADKTIASLL